MRTNVRAYVNKAKYDEGVLYWTRDKGYLVKYRYGQVIGAIFEYSKGKEMWEPFETKPEIVNKISYFPRIKNQPKWICYWQFNLNSEF